MAKYRVMRGTTELSIGATYTADSAKDAVRQDNESTAKIFGEPDALGLYEGVGPAPILAVYELIPVPVEEWA